MLNKFSFFKKSSKKEIEQTLKNANMVCKEIVASKFAHLGILDYKYSTKEAVEELGLDNELVHQLVEDYVTQIIKATLQFETYFQSLVISKEMQKSLNYTPFRELAHKNLGVARNLRIKDAELLLYEMMVKEDLEYLQNCLKALKACSIKLKPECAYNTLKLIEVKSSF